MRTFLKFLSHIGRVANAEKGKRVFYSILHIVAIVLGVVAFLGAMWLARNNHVIAEQTLGGWVLSLIGMVVLFVFSVLMFIEGFLAQFILMICGFIGLRNPEERGYCVVTVVIALLSLIAAVVAVAWMFGGFWAE